MFDPSALAAGDRFLLTFTIDDSAVDTNGGSGSQGPLASFGGAATMTLARMEGNVGSFDFAGIDFKASVAFNITGSGVGGLQAVDILFFPDRGPQLFIPTQSIYFGSGNGELWDLSLRFHMAAPVSDTGVGQTLASRLADSASWSSFYVYPYFSFDNVAFPISLPASTVPEPVPEPSVWALGLVSAGLGAWWRRRRRQC